MSTFRDLLSALHSRFTAMERAEVRPLSATKMGSAVPLQFLPCDRKEFEAPGRRLWPSLEHINTKTRLQETKTKMAFGASQMFPQLFEFSQIHLELRQLRLQAS